MKIAGFIWLEDIIQKLIWKHLVKTGEVSEIFLDKPMIRLVENEHRKDENIYVVFGQTDAGRYLVCFFRSQNRQSGFDFIGLRYERYGREIV